MKDPKCEVELGDVRCIIDDVENCFVEERGKQVAACRGRQLAKHVAEAEALEQKHNADPKKWSSGGSFSDKVQFGTAGAGHGSSEDDSDSEGTTDSADGWEEVFSSRSPLTRVPTARGPTRASLELHSANRTAFARHPSRLPRRTSLDIKGRATHTDFPGHNSHIPATPCRDRRLSLEVDRQAAVYYYGNPKEGSTEAESFAASRSLARSSSRRRSGSYKELEMHLPSLVSSGESASADFTCAADIIPPGVADNIPPCAADLIPHEAMAPMPIRACRRRRSLDVARPCGLPHGSGTVFAYDGLSGERQPGAGALARSQQSSSPCESSSPDFLESSVPHLQPIGLRQGGHLSNVAEAQPAMPLGAAMALPRGPPQLQLPWSATDTEGVETSEASDANEFLNPWGAASRGQAARPNAHNPGFGRRTADFSEFTYVLAGPTAHLRGQEPCAVDFNTDEAETSDASNEGEFLSARSEYAAKRSNLGNVEMNLGAFGSKGRGPSSHDAVKGNLASAWESTRSQWRRQRQSVARGGEQKKSLMENFFRK